MYLSKGIRGNLYYANLFYIISFISYLINTFLNHTMFAGLSSYKLVKVILFSLVLFFLFSKFLFVDRWNWKRLSSYIGLMLLMILISLKTGDRQLITLLALILGASNVNFRYILLSFFLTNIVMLIATYLFTIIDVIPNLQYYRIRDGEIRIRNSFGTGYPTIFAAYLQSLVIAYAYLMKPNKILGHVFLWLLALLCSYIVLEFADARMSGYSIFLFLFIYYFCLCFFRNIANKIILILLISCTYLVCFGIIFYLSYHFNAQDEIFYKINDVLSGRLHLAYKAFQEYKIPLLGQNVEFIGLGGAVQTQSEDYNYVDSSYLQFLMKYGVVFSALSIIGFMWLTFKRLRLNDYKFIAVIAILSFNSMIEDRLLDISINVYWVLMLAYYNNFQLPITRAKDKIS